MGIQDIDNHKLSYHPQRVAEWLSNDVCFPLHVELGITNRCNHRCRFCTLGWITHGSNDIDTDVMIRTLDSFKKVGVKSIYFAGEGEPTLHSGLVDFISYADSLNIKTSMSTNGSNFKDNVAKESLKYLSWIRFSLDASTPETYKILHGIEAKGYYQVLQNIRDAVKIKKDNNYNVNIGVQAIFESQNAKEMLDMGKMLKEIGVDNFQIKPAHSHPNSSYKPDFYDFTNIEFVKQLEDLQSEIFKVVVRLNSLHRLKEERTYKQCHAFHFYSLIDAKGDVVPCNVFYNNSDFIYGNINEQSFEDIWNSQKRIDIIKKIDGLNNKYCGNYRCRLDVMNRYLHRLKCPEINDEFI